MPKPSIPADVPRSKHQEFLANYAAITKNTNHLFLFACDQKIEHLNDDFDPDDEDIDADAINPEHFFKIASQGSIGAMATQLALISRYGIQYPQVPYVAKLNSKTNLIPETTQDPLSASLWSVDDVIRIKQESNLKIHGVGVTIYPGSAFESEMMQHAAQTITEAHAQGMVAIVWMYPRGKAIKNDIDPHLLAGVVGMANALGADFVKIKSPKKVTALPNIVVAAGNTHVIISGGAQKKMDDLLRNVYAQIHTGKTAGCAIGRNIFQHDVQTALKLTRALHALIYENKKAEEAIQLLA